MDIMPTQVYEHDSFEATQRVTFDSQQNESQEVGILRIDEVSYIIKKGTNKIGRHPNCNVVLNNDTVSGHHAEIEAGVVSGTAFISDTNSTNGTKLKSVSLKPGRAYQLKDGDTIEFGKVNAIYEIPSECLVLNTPLIVKPKQRNLTVIPSIPDSFTEDLLDKEKNDSLIPSSQEGEDNIFRNPSLLCKTYNVRKNIGISVQNETASKDYSKDIQKAMRSENKIIDNLDNLESQGIESDIHNAETQLNHLVTCKIEKNKDTCDMETHFKECSSDTENKQLDVSEMETQVNDWITRSSNSIYEKETQLDLIDSSRGESASRQQEYSDIHDMETQINLFDNDNTKETLQDGNKETAKDIDEDIYVFETQENVEEQRNPIAKENSKIIVESDDEDVKEVAENNTETQTSKSFATITNEDAKNSDLRESSPISSSEKVMIVNSPLKNKTSPGKRLPLRFNMCISDSDSDSVGEEKSSKKSPQDALKLSVNMDVSEGISLKKDDLTSINVDETAKASTSKGNNEGNQRNSDNELSGESDDLFEVATQQNNIINQGTQSKISNSLSQTITRQDDDAIFYATTQIVSTTKEIVEKIDVAKSDSIENSENSVADKSIGAVSIETKITSTSNGGICQLNSVEKNKVSKNCNDCTGDERGVANEEGSQITEDKNESLNSDYHMQPTQLLQFSDVQDNSEEEHGASVEDLEYELAPTQLLCVLESQRQEKSPSPKNVSSNSKKTDTRKTNLNDSVEKNLNDMFETVTEEVYQPPQISTQYLNDALELSETEIETPNDNLATKGNVDENVQKNSVASGSIHQDCFDEPSKCLTAKNHQAMDQEDYFKNIRSDGKHSSFIHSQKTDEIEVISSEIDRNVKPCTSSTQKKMKFDLESTQPNSDVPNTSSNEVMKNSKPKRRRKIKKGTGLESDSQYSGESDICSQLSGTSLELNTETKKLTVASASISKNVKVPEESSKNVKNSVGPDTSAKLNINTIPEVDSQESYFVNFKFNRKCKNIIEDEPSDPIVLTEIPKAAPISKRGRRKTTNNDVVNKIVSIPKEHEKRKSRTTVQDIEGPKANESVEKPGINKRKRESSKSKLSPSSTQMLTEVIISSPRSRRSKRQKVNESQENSQNSTMRIPIKANKPAIRSKRQSNQDIQQAEQESKNTAGKGSQIRHSARIKGKKEVSQNQSIIITKKPEIVPAKRRKVEETEKLSTVIRRSARSDKTTSESILNYFPSGTPISSTSQSKNKSSRDNTIDVISGSNELVKKTSSSFSTMSSCSTFGEGLIVTSTPSRTRMSTSKLNFNSSSQIKHKILFTGIQDNEFNKILKELGAVKSEDPRKCTVLVTDKIRRTFKFLCALAASVPIVSINWLHDSQTAGTFLDYDNYILKDPAMEAKFGFKLRKSLEISRQKKLLDGYIVILTSNIPTPPITELKNMITACGGKALIRPPTPWSQKSVIISCEKDIDHAKKLLTKAPNNVTIQSTEFLLTGILKQELNFVKTRLV